MLWQYYQVIRAKEAAKGMLAFWFFGWGCESTNLFLPSPIKV